MLGVKGDLYLPHISTRSMVMLRSSSLSCVLYMHKAKIKSVSSNPTSDLKKADPSIFPDSGILVNIPFELLDPAFREYSTPSDCGCMRGQPSASWANHCILSVGAIGLYTKQLGHKYQDFSTFNGFKHSLLLSLFYFLLWVGTRPSLSGPPFKCHLRQLVSFIIYIQPKCVHCRFIHLAYRVTIPIKSNYFTNRIAGTFGNTNVFLVMLPI